MNPALFANPQLFQAYQNDPRMALAQGLMQQGASTTPVRSPLEGLARALQGGVGGFFQGQARRDFEDQGEKYRKGLAEALKGGDVIGALSASDDPYLNQLGLDAQLKRAMQPAEKDPLVKVFDAASGLEKWVKTSEAAGMQASGPQGPSSAIAKIQADLKAGLITPEQAQAAIRKETYIRPPDTTTVNVGPSGIDYGDPEPGLAWKRNADGTVALDERGAPIALPYQGGKPYAELQKVNEAKATKEGQQQQAADIVTQDIDRALALADGATLPTTGLAGNFLKDIGGTAANDTRALLDTIKANVGFDKLQQMRASSPTGGALGSITEGELRLLSSVLGNLEQSQSKDQFKSNLGRLKEIYLDVIHGPGNRPGGAQPTAPQPDAAIPPPPPGFEVVP